MGIEGEGRESKIEDRRLTGIIPIRGAPWVSFVPHLVAGVLAGVGEEVEVAVESVVEVAVASDMEVAVASDMEVAGASDMEVAGATTTTVQLPF